MTVPRGAARLTATAPPTTIDFVLGPTPPAFAGGYGGWETIERPKRRPLNSWKAIPARTLELDLLLDGYADGQSKERDIAALERVATGSANTPPPPVQIAGPGIPGSSLTWLIDDLTWGAALIDESGQRTRATLQLKLVERIDDQLLAITNPAKNLKPATGKRYRVKRGDTLTKIAARQLGSAKRWREIAKLNVRKGHPRRSVKDVVVGEILRLPPESGSA